MPTEIVGALAIGFVLGCIIATTARYQAAYDRGFRAGVEWARKEVFGL